MHIKNDYKKCGCSNNCIINVDYSRNSLLTSDAIRTLKTYRTYEIDPQDLFANVARKFASNCQHAQNLYNYISTLKFSFSSPIYMDNSSYISCFLDNGGSNTEQFLARLLRIGMCLYRQGGMSVDISALASTSTSNLGIIRNAKVLDEITSCMNNLGGRQPNLVVMLRIDHPDIIKFINIRRNAGAASERVNTCHHGVIMTAKFMQAVLKNEEYDIVETDGTVIQRVNAQHIYLEVIRIRRETGEPYIMYEENAEKYKCESYKILGIGRLSTNLCTEIVRCASIDHLGKERTAVCCLGSVNLEKYDEFKDDHDFFADICKGLDNVLDEFVRLNENLDYMSTYVYSVVRERSIGIGTTGLEDYRQSRSMTMNSEEFKEANIEIFRNIREKCNLASIHIGKIFGASLDNQEAGLTERFGTKLAIAPNHTIASIMNSSAGITPYFSMYYVYKTIVGSLTHRNKHLDKIINERYPERTEEIWSKIRKNDGSVQSLEEFTEHEKEVFKTMFETSQKTIITRAAERQQFLCMSQSLNTAFAIPGNNDTEEEKRKKIQYIVDCHILAYKLGIITLYYLYSTSQIKSNVEQQVRSEFMRCEACE